MDSLVDLLNLGEIRDALEQLSQEIDPAYERVMVRIKQQDKRRKALATRILSWITYARRQLSVKELQHALAVIPGRSSVGDHIYPECTLTAVCAGLVVIDEESHTVRFVRESYTPDVICYCANDSQTTQHKSFLKRFVNQNSPVLRWTL